MKKNILIIGNYPPPYGGVPVLVKSFSKYLQSKNYNVFVLSGGTSGYEIIDDVTIIKPGVIQRLFAIFSTLNVFRKILKTVPIYNLVKYPSFTLRLMSYSSIGYRLAKKNDFEAIICYNLFNYGTIGYVIKSFCNNTRLICCNFGEIHSHSDYPIIFKKLISNTVNSIDVKVAGTKHCGNMYNILEKKYDYKIVDKKIKIVTPGVDLENFNLEKTEINVFLNKSKLSSKPHSILYLGRINSELGVGVLLKVIEKIFSNADNVTSYNFTFVGQHGELAGDLKDIIKKFDNNVQYFENADLELVKSSIVNSSFLVAPSLNDRACGCLVASEAGALNKTIIASRIGGIPEYVRDNYNGLLVNPNDVHDLFSKIKQLAENKDLLSKLENNNFINTSDYFNMKHHDKIYHSLINKI